MKRTESCNSPADSTCTPARNATTFVSPARRGTLWVMKSCCTIWILTLNLMDAYPWKWWRQWSPGYVVFKLQCNFLNCEMIFHWCLYRVRPISCRHQEACQFSELGKKEVKLDLEENQSDIDTQGLLTKSGLDRDIQKQEQQGGCLHKQLRQRPIRTPASNRMHVFKSWF